MTPESNVAITLTRLEGKLDTLAVKVDAGDKAAAGLVQLVKTELGNLQVSVGKLEDVVKDGLEKADSAVSTVRVDLQKQIVESRQGVQVEIRDVKSAQLLAVEAMSQQQQRLVDRLDLTDKMMNRIVGGLLLSGSLGVSGLVALVKGW